MEKLLAAIASRLTIRCTVMESMSKPIDGLTVKAAMFNYRDVPDKVREQFKTELNNHLLSHLTELKAGDTIDYNFECGQVWPIGSIYACANDSMAEVLQKLPALSEGEIYSLPVDTYLAFTLVSKDDKEAIAKPTCVCHWIMEEYAKTVMSNKS